VDTCAIRKSSVPTLWLPELKLLESDKEAFLSPTGWLTDSIVNAVQSLINKQFPDIKGFQDTCLESVHEFNICKENLFKFYIHQVIG